MSALKPRLAFAGLGAMGYGMASHLLRSAYPLVVFDVYTPAMHRLVAEGASSAQSPREAARNAEFLICMVANSGQATSLLFDSEAGAVEALPINGTILMCSTVTPAYIHETRRKLDELGRSDVRLIDCPVSGGPGRAADGSLSIFSSGDEAHHEHARSVLESMSSKLYRVPGGLSAGSKMKMVHQVFAAVNIAMASEAMGLAAAAGINTQQAFKELKSSEGDSFMLRNRVPHMLDPGLPTNSAITIIAKDVAMVTKTGRDSKLALPLVSTAEQLYMTSISAGWGKEDDSILVRLYLPGEPDLVSRLATPSVNIGETLLSVGDVADLMVGVHLAVIIEAMSFCLHLGIDSNMMLDVVSNAAGASSVFVKLFSKLQEANWSIKKVDGTEQIRARLANAIDKTFQLRYPLFLSSAALQELNRQMQ